MNVKAKCTNCGEIVLLSKDDIKFCKLKDDDIVEYWTCPTCKEKMYVQFDNEETKELVHQISTVMRKIMISKSKKKKVPSSLREEYTSLNDSLNKVREKLSEKYKDYIEVKENAYCL